MSDPPDLPIWKCALLGLCPKCSERTLFAAPARIAPTCSACGLKLAQRERGARAAGLITILVAALLITVAIGIENALGPPIWLQMLVWAPLTAGAVIGALRLFKTYMLKANYDRQLRGKDRNE